MTGNPRVAAAARALVGARFRLHGREPATGLDCVGVAAASLREGGWRHAVPDDYPLRGGDGTRVAGWLDARLRPVAAPASGDVVLARAGPGQWHLAVRVADGFVHADALLRRVVERPGELPWPIAGAWRLEED